MPAPLFRIALLWAAAGMCPAVAGPISEALRAGACDLDITPALPIVTSGQFLPRTATRAEGTLHARALALDDGSTRLVIMVVDSLMMPRDLVDRVKQAASDATGISPEKMLVSATHTHSAPALMGALATDENAAYREFVVPRMVQAIAGAVKNLAPARVGWAVVQDAEHTHCRRWILRPDRIRSDPFGKRTVRANMHPGYKNRDFVGPSGPSDPDLTVLAFQTLDGRPLAILANYSMHYVGVPEGVLSPDYYGPFAEKMRSLTGAPVVIMSQGTSGDQMWMDYGQAERKMTPGTYAGEVARVAFRAYQSIRYLDRAPLNMAESKVHLSRRVPDGERLAWAKGILSRLAGAPPKTLPEVYAREQLYLAAEPERELKPQALRIGELGIAAIPCEVFAISGLKIKAQSPLEPSFAIELANGAEGYIPPPDQHKLGGYTTWPARSAGLEVNAEPRIVDRVLGLLEEVSGRRRRPIEQTEGAYTEAILAAKPLAYWRGEEFSGPVAHDVTPNHNDGRYEGFVAFYLEGPPLLSGNRINRAPHFAGGRLYGDVEGLAAPYSVELWFSNRLPAGARATTGYLFSRGTDCLGVTGTASTPGKLLFAAGGRVLEGTSTVDFGTWNHVIVSRGPEKVTVYLNGTAVPEISAAVSAAPTERRVYVGGSIDGSANFVGKIDEVAIFPRPLTAAEAARHFGVVRGPLP